MAWSDIAGPTSVWSSVSGPNSTWYEEWSGLMKILSGSGTWNPGDLIDGAGETSSGIIVSGAVLGDFVLVSAPYDLQGITCNGYVSIADTVNIRLQNETGGAINLASGTWKAIVLQQ